MMPIRPQFFLYNIPNDKIIGIRIIMAAIIITATSIIGSYTPLFFNVFMSLIVLGIAVANVIVKKTINIHPIPVTRSDFSGFLFGVMLFIVSVP